MSKNNRKNIMSNFLNRLRGLNVEEEISSPITTNIDEIYDDNDALLEQKDELEEKRKRRLGLS